MISDPLEYVDVVEPVGVDTMYPDDVNDSTHPEVINVISLLDSSVEYEV